MSGHTPWPVIKAEAMAKKKKRKKHASRAWLNDDLSRTGFVATVVELKERGYDDTAFVDSEVSIADCSRVVGLEFYASNAEDAERGMRKADLLVAELVRWRRRLRKAYREAGFIP